MFSILSPDKLNIIKDLCFHASLMDGSAAEVGVYKGGTAAEISKWLPKKTLHLFDTFTGMPEKGPLDVHEMGDFSDTSLEFVKTHLSGRENIIFHAGLFPADYQFSQEEKFCFVHLDADQYGVTREALELFYPHMVKGGYIVLDDYGYQNCPGVKTALWDFLVGKEEEIVQKTDYQAYIQRK